MKLSKLIEQEDEPIPSSDIPSKDDVKVRARDIINKTINKWKSNYLFDKQFNIPEGMIRVGCIFDTPTEDEKPTIELGLTYVPKMDPKPVIPNDLLAKAVEKFIEDIIIMNPNLLNNTERYPMEVLNEYYVTFYNVVIYPSEGVVNLFNFIPRSLYNIKIKSPQKFGYLLKNRSYLLNHYTFDDNVIPKFSDNYSTEMERVIRKCKTVYNTLQKGTWNGMKYELSPFYQPNIVVHQETADYSVESGVLHPNFHVSYSGSWPSLNGEKLNHVLPVQTQDEFMEFIKKRFKHFNIQFS